MKGRWASRLAYAGAGAAVLLLAYWLRNPLIPYGEGTPSASSISSDSTRGDEADRRRLEAVTALSRAIQEKQKELAQYAYSALSAPQDPELSFEFLRNLDLPQETGVLVADPTGIFAWAGQFRANPAFTGPGTSVTFSPFYATLQVAASRAGRTAVASALLHAEPPADRIAEGLAEELAERQLVTGFRFAPLSDTTADAVISGVGGHPLVRVDAAPLSNDMIRFARSANARGWGAATLGLALIAFLGFAWADRRALGQRLFALVVAFVAVGLVPWNNFSNLTRLFDPAFFYSPIAGPFTANAGVFLMAAILALAAVIAFMRARLPLMPRTLAAIAAVALAMTGGFAIMSAAEGIVLPRWGATAALWISWQLPLFLTLFAFVLAAFWLLRAALGIRRMVQLRSASMLAVVCAAVATFAVWTKTTEQRLQLAMRDVAGLERPDSEATQLLTRFGSELSAYDSAGTRADLLERFAISDLAAAGLQVSLAIRAPDGTETAHLELADVQYDSAFAVSLAREATASGQPIVRQLIGPAGRQVMLAVPHSAGGTTTVVASPRTRLVAENAYLPLLGFEEPDKTEPPYTLTLADAKPGEDATSEAMTWRRVASEWHGDEIIATSRGKTRAHVEVDLRSWPTRLVRAALIVIMNVVVAGILWALATMTETGFFRWARSGSVKWIRSYRGRLTLALFMFFVVPAVGFAVWSYQRLQRDDRGMRELLVHEILNASVASSRVEPVLEAAGNVPLFTYADGVLTSSSDSLYEMLAPAGRMLPRRVYVNLALHGELSVSARQTIAGSTMVWGYRSAPSAGSDSYVIAAPARSDEISLDRRRRDLTLLVMFATVVGAIAAFWLSGFAARILARDLELSKVEVARAERVIAWGEMARQVAHEIKNPLTPIRLGVQHLRRARSDPRIDFDRVLDENVTRILSEIDRLDKIARTFSRYGSAPEEMPPAGPVDVSSILRDVVALEKMGIGGVDWNLTGADEPRHAMARKDELRDVMLNVFENSRLARARKVRVELSSEADKIAIVIEDDGIGIERTAAARVFEPHFSTRTTGSGLGLAISRRLIESWGGTIDLASEEGKGARVTIKLQPAIA
ncbi:MAG: sensor histidine kinase [Gemmatimonas sp.]